jgi:plastocyanin
MILVAWSPPTRAHGDATSSAGSLAVLLSEWSLDIDPIRVRAGVVRVHALNEGAHRHNVTVAKAGTFSEIYQTPLLEPGEALVLPLLFAKGEYNLYCSVPGHAYSGMIAYLVVDEAASDFVPISAHSHP